MRTVELSVTLDASYARSLPELCVPWGAAEAPAPAWLVVNDDLAASLGLDPLAVRSDDGLAAFAGHALPAGADPVAQAYAGHQFGGYSPLLGDGRALLLGELVDPAGRRRDVHLKGSGRTPFARGGDGKAAVGPMLREYVVGEAMHGLGIPTTRALGVLSTGEQIARDTMLPGAVLCRIAASHLRVGTFQYASATGDHALLARLADYAIGRHASHLDPGDPDRHLALYDAVVGAQAELVARWMLVGFVHGVMNTDNTTISGETIDYGPCAFVDAYDPAAVFSSIDHGGRYAYGNQPAIASWNLARLAEAMLPLFAATPAEAAERATPVLHTFAERFSAAYRRGLAAKLGLGVWWRDASGDEPTVALFEGLLALLAAQRVDLTSFFRRLSGVLRGDPAPVRALFAEPAAFDAWSERWRRLVDTAPGQAGAAADQMDAVNPVYLARNHLVEEALAAATDGDLTPVERLVDALRRPYDERRGLEPYAEPAPAGFGPYRTFCGT